MGKYFREINIMTLALVWSVLLSLISHASSQNIQIQALPPTVTLRENDLVILCSITDPSLLNSILFIELMRNATVNFTTIVSVVSNDEIKWADTTLQSRGAAAVGSAVTFSLNFTINKDIVRCPDDFKMYKCKMSGLDTSSIIVTKESASISIAYIVKPTVMEMPRVRILNEPFDTPYRRFPTRTAIQMTCEGQIGNEASSTIRWCAQKAGYNSFTRLSHIPIHSEASSSGCQYTRSSTITYNLTNEDTFTRFLCESGDTGLCGSGSAKQYVNITIVRPTLIEMPRVRILSEHNDTTKRRFPVGTVLQITCQGQVGTDPNNTIGWCVQKVNDVSFRRLGQTPVHSEDSHDGNQYIRSSTITYSLTREDTFTRFLCESGDYSACGSGSAIQYVNVTIETTDAGKIAGGVIGGVLGVALIGFIVYAICRQKRKKHKYTVDKPGPETEMGTRTLAGTQQLEESMSQQ